MSAAIDYGYLPTGRYVLNHDIMHCTAEGVVGNHLYSGRALGVSEPWDMVQLHPALRSQWPGIYAHYRRIGLRHSDQIIWNLDPEHLGGHIGYHPSVFYFGAEECRHWGDDEWLETVEFINSKNNFMALAQALDVEVPATRCFHSVTGIGPVDRAQMTYPCYLKAAVSVSGVGIHRCQTEEELLAAMGRFDAGVPVQLQEEVAAERFLNLQYRVIGDRVMRLEASEQILDGFAHQGNRVPAGHAPWAAVDPMAHWLKERGMKGVFAFDVAVVQTEAGLRFPVIECNPRFNGATYPTLIARKLNISQWSALNLSTDCRRLADIDLSGIEFDKATGIGVVIVNWGTVLAGRLAVLLAGPPEHQERLAVELRARL